MSRQQLDNAAIAILMLVNAVLVFTLLVKLRTTPADVLAMIEQKELHNQLRITELEDRQQRILQELLSRGEWMESQNKWRAELESRTEDRFRLSEFNEWAGRNNLPGFEREPSDATRLEANAKSDRPVFRPSRHPLGCR